MDANGDANRRIDYFRSEIKSEIARVEIGFSNRLAEAEKRFAELEKRYDTLMREFRNLEMSVR